MSAQQMRDLRRQFHELDPKARTEFLHELAAKGLK